MADSTPTPSEDFMQQLCLFAGSELARRGRPNTYTEMGKYLGASSSRIGQWKNGKVQLTLNKAVELINNWNQRAEDMQHIASLDLIQARKRMIWRLEPREGTNG